MAVEMTESGAVFPPAPIRGYPLIRGFTYIKASSYSAAIYSNNGMDFLRGGSTLTGVNVTHPWLGVTNITAPNAARNNPFTGAVEVLYMRIK